VSVVCGACLCDQPSDGAPACQQMTHRRRRRPRSPSSLANNVLVCACVRNQGGFALLVGAERFPALRVAPWGSQARCPYYHAYAAFALHATCTGGALAPALRTSLTPCALALSSRVVRAPLATVT
jgi:hypothetical protein